MTVQEYVDQIANYLLIEPDAVKVEETDEFIFVKLSISEEDAGKMIGKHGETLSSLSHLITISFRDQLADRKVIVDVNDYKERREEEARDMGAEYARRALETDRPQHLPRALQAHQRRAIHQELQEFVGVFTQSEGEGRERHLVVYPESYRDTSANADASAEVTAPQESAATVDTTEATSVETE